MKVITIQNIICGLLVLGVVSSLSAEVQITKCRFFEPYFREPIEYFIFVFDDDAAYLFTSGDEREIDIGVPGLLEIFKKLGYDISRLVLIIHNHVLPQTWSVGHGDRGFVADLRAAGFKGPAILYLPGGKLQLANF